MKTKRKPISKPKAKAQPDAGTPAAGSRAKRGSLRARTARRRHWSRVVLEGWLAHPTRAGWWVRWLKYGGMETVFVEQLRNGALVIQNGSLYESARSWPGRWAGPIIPPTRAARNLEVPAPSDGTQRPPVAGLSDSGTASPGGSLE